MQPPDSQPANHDILTQGFQKSKIYFTYFLKFLLQNGKVSPGGSPPDSDPPPTGSS